MHEGTTDASDRDEEIDLGGPCGRIKWQFYDSVERRAQERLRRLPPGEIVTVEWLLGVPYWRSRKPGDQRRAGRAVAHMQAVGLLDVDTFPKSKKSTRYYRLP